jgi:outer membrane protein OmpA-like peptidoglycan-associated protein
MCRQATAALMLMVLGACAPSSYVVLLENEDGSTGKVIVEGKQGTSTVSRAGHGAALDGSSEKSFEVEKETVAKVFGAAIAAQPQTPVSFMLYFLSDSAELKAGSRTELEKAVAAMRARKAPDVSVIGHADRAGDETYNHRLALRRATAIADRIRQTNIDITDITITSHGENNPVVATADGVNEPKNRRVQITVR